MRNLTIEKIEDTILDLWTIATAALFAVAIAVALLGELSVPGFSLAAASFVFAFAAKMDNFVDTKASYGGLTFAGGHLMISVLLAVWGYSIIGAAL